MDFNDININYYCRLLFKIFILLWNRKKKLYFDIENFMPCDLFFVHSEGWNLDGPVDNPPPIPWNSVSVHADDPHHHLHRRRPRDSRRAAAASKQTTPHSTVGRWRIRSVCSPLRSVCNRRVHLCSCEFIR